MIIVRHARLTAALTVILTASLIATLLPTAMAQKPAGTVQPDLAVNEPENPHSLGYRTAGYGETPSELVSSENQTWRATYLLWKEGISTSTSALGAVAPAHGREDVLTYADAIHASVSLDLELLVAASIAHQASDIRDRPFGTDLVEEFWRQHMKANASVGIAQLRPEEVVYWAPELVGQDLLAPEVAIRVMAAKLSKANHYILRTYSAVDPTDRYMLLAIVQNTSSEPAMRRTIDYFFHGAKRNWNEMLYSAQGERLNWRKQLRLVFLHADWLLSQGWEKPAGLDSTRWATVAFSEEPDDPVASGHTTFIGPPNHGR
jgi:hypothetical protein